MKNIGIDIYMYINFIKDILFDVCLNLWVKN